MKTVGLIVLVQIFTVYVNLTFTKRSLDRPHIIVIVADDLGWNDVSYHGSAQIPTPNIDALAADGLQLDSHYVNPICSPSRSALLSGYYPIHTGLQHDVIYSMEPYGMPLKLTILPQHLKRLGYATHAVGKGTSYGLDLRDGMNPVWNNTGKYSTELYTGKAVDIIRNHRADQPLFLYLAHSAVHVGNGFSPLEAPPKYTSRFSHISDIRRRLFAGMMAALDDSVGEVMRALSESWMLGNSIVLLISDNGGAAGGIDNSIGSNFPMRGSKATLWEGGVRGPAVLWSPLLTTAPGQTCRQLMHIVDWLPTLYTAAGGDSSDLGSIDGMDMWSALQGLSSWPRNEILLNIDPIWNMAALIKGKYKMVLGSYPGNFNSWYGPSGRDNASMSIFERLPDLANKSLVAHTLRRIGRHFTAPSLAWYLEHNVSCPAPPANTSLNSCNNPMVKPCLFDLQKDPCETEDISGKYPDILLSMASLLRAYNSSSVQPLNKPRDPRGDPVNYNFLWTNWMDAIEDKAF